jgi:acyl carrier protein
VKACQSLLLKETDISLAGSVSLLAPNKLGYLYDKNGFMSPDGFCKPFSEDSAGTVPSSGAAVVVLKRLSDAIKDNDHIEAVINGYAVNNDGNNKVGFTAPSVSGQQRCIQKAHNMANIHPENISYIEAHGTGTTLGDPVEIAALTQYFNTKTVKKQFCAIGSVKSTIGHTGASAGVAGLIKTILMLKHRECPPVWYGDMTNKNINFPESPFYINTKLQKWENSQKILTAGVSSFGLGGTNAHVVLQSYQKKLSEIIATASCKVLILSAKNEHTLVMLSHSLRNFLKNIAIKNDYSDSYLDDVAYTLQMGREDFPFRRAWVCKNMEDAIIKLTNNDTDVVIDDLVKDSHAELYNIAKSWVSKDVNNWNKIHLTRHNRVALPTYLFTRQPYGIDSINQANLHQSAIVYDNDSSTIKEKLVNIFCDVLGYKSFDIEKDFYELGGDSLAALDAVLKIETIFKIDFSIGDLFVQRNVSTIADYIDKFSGTSRSPSSIIKLKEGKSSTSKPISEFVKGVVA